MISSMFYLRLFLSMYFGLFIWKKKSIEFVRTEMAVEIDGKESFVDGTLILIE